MLSIDSIVVGALSILLATVVAWRWVGNSGVRGSIGVESTLVSGVHGGPKGQGRGHIDRVQGPDVRVRGTGAEVSPAAMQPPLFCNSRAIPPPIERGSALLPASDHVTEFILWASVDEDGQAHHVRFRDKQLVGNYRTWAVRLGIVPLPESILLRMIARHPQVKKSRERVKDKLTGRVLHLPSGTPQRETIYTISPPRKSAKPANASTDGKQKTVVPNRLRPLEMKEAA
ncbi:hypothetical protein [Hyphomicrobium sp. LHD-15]|uniref:hypothetical protein n=1 Tax=Hyphomicrobium sp. LHD-15 TaxID=3072142 RepID=UPI00280D779A|nr:hypothetical protein [Hyphomicrobium sp. LHD-15]MDQ8700587.1 hypothetical protein [Hyphomicrobium sp. LHD-15]